MSYSLLRNPTANGTNDFKYLLGLARSIIIGSIIIMLDNNLFIIFLLFSMFFLAFLNHFSPLGQKKMV